MIRYYAYYDYVYEDLSKGICMAFKQNVCFKHVFAWWSYLVHFCVRSLISSCFTTDVGSNKWLSYLVQSLWRSSTRASGISSWFKDKYFEGLVFYL